MAYFNGRPSALSGFQVSVRDNNIDQALKVLKRKMQNDGAFRRMKEDAIGYVPKSERKRVKHNSAVERQRKVAFKNEAAEHGMKVPEYREYLKSTGPR